MYAPENVVIPFLIFTIRVKENERQVRKILTRVYLDPTCPWFYSYPSANVYPY